MPNFKVAPAKPMISHDDLEKIDVRVGTILLVEDVVRSDSLVKLIVDFVMESNMYSQFQNTTYRMHHEQDKNLQDENLDVVRRRLSLDYAFSDYFLNLFYALHFSQNTNPSLLKSSK